MKTLRDLAEMVADKEAVYAPGSETIILGAFVEQWDCVSRVLDGDSEFDLDADVSDDYEVYATAYRKLADGNEDVW